MLVAYTNQFNLRKTKNNNFFISKTIKSEINQQYLWVLLYERTEMLRLCILNFTSIAFQIQMFPIYPLFIPIQNILQSPCLGYQNTIKHITEFIKIKIFIEIYKMQDKKSYSSLSFWLEKNYCVSTPWMRRQESSAT